MKTCIVDSFTDVAFKGNPAGVCIVDTELSDETMLLIAQELGLSETAFVRQTDQGQVAIRYFSPKMEIPLCGHATLASARVLFESEPLDHLCFITAEGLELGVHRCGTAIEMTFPAYGTEPAEAPRGLLEALGISEVRNAVFNKETCILLIEVGSTELIAELTPDYAALVQSHDGINGVLVTAASEGDGFDFHSRYFWPWSGTNEDPVTGGTHTFLGPYWSVRLGKTRLKSFQSSARSGFMDVEILDDEKLKITGSAVVVFEGNLRV